MKVKDIMTRDVVTVTTEDTVEKCAGLLLENNFSGLPVLDLKGKLVDIVTEGDLIRRASRIKAPAALALLGGYIYLENPQKFMEEIKRAMAQKAGDLMSKKIVTASPEDTIEDAATLMINKKIKRLPIVDDDEKLVGIISRWDIMNYLYRVEQN